MCSTHLFYQYGADNHDVADGSADDGARDDDQIRYGHIRARVQEVLKDLSADHLPRALIGRVQDVWDVHRWGWGVLWWGSPIGDHLQIQRNVLTLVYW